MKLLSVLFATAIGIGMLCAPASADDVKPGKCFSMRDFNGWKSPDPRTIYIRVGTNSFYRLDLSAPCSRLQQPGIHLITKTRGSDQMCNGIDWELSVADTATIGGGFRQACIVKDQTPLSAAEVAAIPKKFKP